MKKSIKVDFDIKTEMRDGTILNSNIFRPADDELYPVAVTRTPYLKDYITGFPFMDLVRFAQGGYIVVVQDVRGRGKSQGEWAPFQNESADGYDTVEWAAKLPGSNGNVGMWGFSYLGYTQWAAAVMQPPHLKALMPVFTPSDMRNGLYSRGGAMELGLLIHFLLPSLGMDTLFRRFASSPKKLQDALAAFIKEVDNLPKNGYRSLPLKDLTPLVNTEIGVDILRDLIAHSTGKKYSEFPYSIKKTYPDLTIPAYNIAGWYDIFSEDTIGNFTGPAKAASYENKGKSKLLIGPWSHLNYSNVIGEVDFGMAASMSFIDAKIDLVGLTLRWFDYWLKGEENGIMDEPPVKIFLGGSNTWRSEEEWPPKDVEYEPYYLNPDEGLSTKKPASDIGSSGFVYDPSDPVPTLGGALLMHPTILPGPRDQRALEDRSDVLSFTTQILKSDLTVIGHVNVCLWASSNAPGTDFVARLVDVHPNGKAINLTDGIIRACFKDYGSKERIKPNQPVEYTIDLWSVGHVFLAGHCVRLDITSSNFPRWDRNLNTEDEFGNGTHFQKAKQVVFHNSQYASRVILPVIHK